MYVSTDEIWSVEGINGTQLVLETLEFLCTQ